MKRQRPRGLACGAIMWITLGLVGGIGVPRAAAASSTAVVNVSAKTARVGELVQVTGSGWSPVGQTVQIELCGQNALNVSDDCDQGDQYTAAIRAGGNFYGAVVIHLPPAPCPCVILVRNQGSFSGARVPITILGARNVPLPSQPASADPVALSAKVSAPASVAGWFGGPRTVTLVLRVRNLSTTAFTSAALSVNVGRGRNPGGFVLARPMSPLTVGSTQVLRIPVTLPAFTFGSYSIRAQVITGQGQVATVVGTSSYPWGLFLVAALLAQVVLLLLRNRVRARLERTRGTGIPIEEPQPQSEPVEVIDLRTPSLVPGGEAETPVEEIRPLMADSLGVVDLRASSTAPDHPWTISHRLAIFLPEHGLTCSIELLACPAISLRRTTIRAWDGFTASPLDALHEGKVWAEMSSHAASNALVPGEAFTYRGAGLELELRLSAIGPALSMGESRTVLPVRVQGSATFRSGTLPVDIVSTLEQSWVTDAPDGVSNSDSEPPVGSLTYGQVPDGGDSFHLRFGPDGGPEGWLVRGGRRSAIGHALRRIDERAGPYPRQLVVEMTDELGRRAVASGTACNGMAFREGEGLILQCRTDWHLDGVPAFGEDRSEVDLDTWRTATRSLFYSFNGRSLIQPARLPGP